MQQFHRLLLHYNEQRMIYNIQGDGLCSISPLEVGTSNCTHHFLLVSGLEREADSFFSQLALTTVDGYTFLFVGNGDGEIHQVKG